MTFCHPPAGKSSSRSTLKCCAYFCHQGLCMPPLWRPFQMSLQSGQAGLTFWLTQWSHLAMHYASRSCAIHHVTLISPGRWGANSFPVSTFAWECHIPGKLPENSWKQQQEQNIPIFCATEPEVDRPWWISLLCSPQKEVACYSWPTSISPPWCKGVVASVCSCLSLLSSLWECVCKCAEKPACTQEAQECLQNK